ncbi:hypothetical protein [Mesorhizobium sp. KR1-2]|uniref:hypothetical protein n=1 Tax=Mesorhizobium sp. KR1-2 TaxID=3156609 RepID=UPI0032B4F0A5
MREYLALGGAIMAIALLGVSHWQAYRAGAASERSATLSRSVEVLRERNATDDQIRNLDDAGLCRALGGRVSDDGACI